MAHFRVEQSFDKFAVVCEKQRTFAVVVEPPCRIDVLGKMESVQGWVVPFGRKLAENAERLVEENDCGHWENLGIPRSAPRNLPSLECNGDDYQCEPGDKRGTPLAKFPKENRRIEDAVERFKAKREANGKG